MVTTTELSFFQIPDFFQFSKNLATGMLTEHLRLSLNIFFNYIPYTLKKKGSFHRRKLLTCSQKCQWCTSIHLFLEYQYHHKFLKLTLHILAPPVLLSLSAGGAYGSFILVFLLNYPIKGKLPTIAYSANFVKLNQN